MHCRLVQRELVAAQRLHQRRHAAEDFHEHRILRHEDLVLRQILQPQALHRRAAARIHWDEPGYSLEEGRLARAVNADDADFISRHDTEIHTIEEHFFAVRLTEAFDGDYH